MKNEHIQDPIIQLFSISNTGKGYLYSVFAMVKNKNIISSDRDTNAGAYDILTSFVISYEQKIQILPSRQ